MQALSWFTLIVTTCHAIFYLVSTIIVVYVGINVLALLDRINHEMDRREAGRMHDEPTHAQSDKGG